MDGWVGGSKDQQTDRQTDRQTENMILDKKRVRTERGTHQ